MLKLKALSVAPYGTNCYLLTCPETKQALLIDPAGDAEAILEMCANVDVRRILITHGHGDHVMALDEVREALQVPVGMHPADAEGFGIAADFELQDGMRLGVGRRQVRVVHIPGHTPGSVALRFDRRAVVGDAIFQGGPGASRSPEALETILVSLQRTVHEVRSHRFDTVCKYIQESFALREIGRFDIVKVFHQQVGDDDTGTHRANDECGGLVLFDQGARQVTHRRFARAVYGQAWLHHTIAAETFHVENPPAALSVHSRNHHTTAVHYAQQVRLYRQRVRLWLVV